MRTGVPISALTAITILAAAGQIANFGDFRTTEVFKGHPTSIELGSAFQKRFRTQIQAQSTLAANFAGHFRIAEWGCGTSCGSIAVIDMKTGKVYDGPFSVLDYGEAYRYEGGSDDLEYRIFSRLLIARGCPEFKNCGTYYYEWKGDRFEQLRLTPHGPLLR